MVSDMPPKRFQYQLQPVLDKAVAEKQRCQIQLGELRPDLAYQATRLAQLEAQFAQTTQRIAQEHDNLSRARSADDLSRRNVYLEQLHRRSKDQMQQLRQQRNRLSFLQVRIEEKQQELVEKIATVQVQERLKDAARRQHEVEQAKKEENERDDAAIRLWARRSH